MNAKLVFRNTLQVRNQDPMPFMPFVYGLAGRIGNVALSEMCQDPTYYASGMEGAYRLFNYQAMANSFDATLEAEALGCTIEWSGDFDAPSLEKAQFGNVEPADFIMHGRIPTVIEATRRLAISPGREIGIAGVVTGVCTLLDQLGVGGENRDATDIKEALSRVGSCFTRFIRSLCELKIDAVVFREDMLDDVWEKLSAHGDLYKKTYATLFNMVRAYNAFPLVVVKGIGLGRIQDLHRLLGGSGFVLFASNFTEEELIKLKDLSESLKLSFGLPLPIKTGYREQLLDQIDLIEAFANKYRPKGFFYVSDGEIPHDAPLELMHEMMNSLQYSADFHTRGGTK